MVDFYDYRNQARKNNDHIVQRKNPGTSIFNLTDDFLSGVKQERLDDEITEDEIRGQPSEFYSVEMICSPFKKQKTAILDESHQPATFSSNPGRFREYIVLFHSVILFFKQKTQNSSILLSSEHSRRKSLYLGLHLRRLFFNLVSRV